jgi:HD-like signal output (HDOD) protein/prolyl-tRNA editing enzyme YbaK/EbsC (Cys-tRNA(Pro) deacylase)
MSTHTPITTYLQRAGIDFEVIDHETSDSLQQAVVQAGLIPEEVARAVLLGDEQGLVLAVLPLSHVINFAQLFALARRKLEPLDRSAAQYVFTDCELGSIPPLGAPFKVKTLIDESLLELDAVYIEPGSHKVLLRLEGADFRHLHKASQQGRFSNPAKILQGEMHDFVTTDGYARHHGVRQLRPIEGMRERIKSLQHLPPMNNLTARLLMLYRDPDATIDQLAEVIETDPSLSAQVLRHARSPYYGYPGEIETISQAINQVLGFDTVINMGLGISALRPFDIPQEGPLGLHSLWRHGIHTAMLCQSLCSLLPRHMDINPGVAYLAGLLHNFGFLVLGHLLKPEYFLLNRVVAANPEVPLTLIEKRTLGISHTQIGAWLMRAWRMPPALEITAREHHNEGYQGDHSIYPNLVMLANCLLKPYGLGDAAEETPPAAILNALGISLEKAREVVVSQMEGMQELDNLAGAFAG